MAERGALVAAVDVGSSKVAVAVAEAAGGGSLSLLGLGTASCTGVHKGETHDAEKVARAVASALKEAQIASGWEIRTAWLAVGSARARSADTHGSVDLPGGEVSRRELARALGAARDIELPADRRLVHADPRELILDGSLVEGDPLGRTGRRLEVLAHVVTLPAPPIEEAVRACQDVGLRVAGVAYAPYAAAACVLEDGGADEGLVVDLGAGTSGFAVFVRGHLRLAGAVPVGGNHVTSDIAAGLGIPFREAERLKRWLAHAVPEEVPEDDYIDVPVGDEDAGGDFRRLARRELAAIVQMRLEETFELVRTRVERFGLLDVAGSGVRLVGGGADLRGCTAVAERVFGAPAGIGVPAGWSGLDGRTAGQPADAAVLGAIRLAVRARDDPLLEAEDRVWERLRRRLGAWLKTRHAVR